MTPFLTNFRRFPITFRRFPKIFKNCSEGQTNVSGHFTTISEDFPKITEDCRGRPKKIRICFDHTPRNSANSTKAKCENRDVIEICPKCCKKFKCLSAGIYDDESGMMQYYADDCYLCDVCSKEEEWYSY